MSRGGSQNPGGRVDRKRSPPVQAEGPAGRHHQGYQEAFLLLEAGRQTTGQAGARPEAESEEVAARNGIDRPRRGSDRWSSKTGFFRAWIAVRSSFGRRENNSSSP